MTTFPSQPPKPPKAFEDGSGFGKTTPAKISTGETTPPTKTKSQATSTEGKKDHDSGGMIYKTGGIVLASQVLQARMSYQENPNTAPLLDQEECAAPRQV